MQKKTHIPENVWTFLDKAGRDAGRIAAEQFGIEMYHRISDHAITSPIEQMFLAALNVMCRAESLRVNPDPEFTADGKPILRGGVFIDPQVKIGNYRVDFLIANIGWTDTPAFRSVVVELDGHDFHDRNKRQRSYEKARDRFLTKSGFAVLHFTGSDVVSDPYKVAHEVLDAVEAYGPVGVGEYDPRNPFGID